MAFLWVILWSKITKSLERTTFSNFNQLSFVQHVPFNADRELPVQFHEATQNRRKALTLVGTT